MRPVRLSALRTPLHASSTIRPNLHLHLHLHLHGLHPRPSTHLQPPRHQTRLQSNFRYRTFANTPHPFLAWARRPTFYYEVALLAGLVGAFYISNLETVPISNRRRFNIISAAQEAKLATSLQNDILRAHAGRVLAPAHRDVARVKRVLAKLLPAAGLAGSTVYVLSSPEENAFVIPGGTVFVYTGILRLCNTDAELATVLAHEIAHNLAHHAAESMSRSLVLSGIVLLASVFGLGGLFPFSLADMAFLKPKSRAQESEADYIGLLMMAQSCYDPRAAVRFWKVMEGQGGAQPPPFLSTHPSHKERIKRIEEWMGEAMAKFEDGDCGSLGGLVDEFRARWPPGAFTL